MKYNLPSYVKVLMAFILKCISLKIHSDFPEIYVSIFFGCFRRTSRCIPHIISQLISFSRSALSLTKKYKELKQEVKCTLQKLSLRRRNQCNEVFWGNQLCEYGVTVLYFEDCMRRHVQRLMVETKTRKRRRLTPYSQCDSPRILYCIHSV
jgi:hypothetical protein